MKAVGGTETHVHVALQIPPAVPVSKIVAKLKGGSAYAANKQFQGKKLVWQRGYGAVTFAGRHLSAVVEYVRRQKEHHAPGGCLNEKLEQFGADPEP